MSFFIRKKGLSVGRGGQSVRQLPKRLTDRVGTTAATSDGRSRRGERTTRRGGGGSTTIKGARRKRINGETGQNEPKKRHNDDEEITSEEEELENEVDEGEEPEEDLVDEETPQQTRIRLAKEQISEARKRLKRRRTEESEDEGDDDAALVGKLLKEQEMVEEGRAAQKVMPDAYDKRELTCRVLLRGGKVMKSPLTSISTATTASDSSTVANNNIVVYASTKSGHVMSINLGTAKKTHLLLSSSSPPAPVTCVSASSRFVAACTPAQISLLDPETLKVVKVLSGSRGAVRMCIEDLGPGSRSTLYSCHKDRTIKVWDLEEGAYVESLFGHQDIPTWVDSSASVGRGTVSNRLLVSTGGFDRTIRVWKVNEESHLVYNCWDGEDLLEVVKVLGGGLFVVGGGCSGSLGLYCFGRKRVLDVVAKAHGVDAAGVPRWITALGGLGDFVASGSDDGTIKVWRVEEIGKRRTLKFVRDVCIEGGSGVVIGIDVFVAGGSGGDEEKDAGELSMVVGLGTEMRNGRWGGRVCNVSRVVVVT